MDANSALIYRIKKLSHISNIIIYLFLSNVCRVFINATSTNKNQKKKIQKPNAWIPFSTQCQPSEHVQLKLKKALQETVDDYQNKRLKYKQKIKCNRTNQIIEPHELEKQWNGRYKKLIVITPGGLYGYYMLGISRYIKLNYRLDDYVFTGSSAGAWCSLFLCLKNKKKISMVLFQIMKGIQEVLLKKTIYEFLFYMKQRVLELTTESDYNLEQLYIGVLTYENYELNTTIHCNFTSLEDALNCCISSSNIPFITGEFSHKYQGNVVLDGVFAKYPFLNILEPSLVITPKIWDTPHVKNNGNSLLVKEKMDLLSLCLDGFNDTLINNDILCEFLD